MKLPVISSPVKQVLTHLLVVFGSAFIAQVVAGYTGVFNESTLLALLTSAAAAGLVATLHVILGLIPAETGDGGPLSVNAVGISLKVQTAGYQVLISALSTFLMILGAQLVAGAAGIGSLPDVTAVVTSAIAAAVAGAVQAVVGLIPAPKPAPA